MKISNEILSHYVGAFAKGAMAVLLAPLAATAAGSPSITLTVLEMAVAGGCMAAWMYSISPPVVPPAPPVATQLIAEITPNPKGNS